MAVITVVFQNNNAFFSEQFFFPFFCLPGHVHDHTKAQTGTHDTDAQAQIACGPHLDRIPAVKLAKFFAVQLVVFVSGMKDFGLESQLFCYFQNLMDTASGFYGTGHRQVDIVF